MPFPNWSIEANKMSNEPSARKTAKSRKQNKRITESGRNGRRIFLTRTDKFRPRNKKTREGSTGYNQIPSRATNGRPRNREFVSLTETPRGMGMERGPVTAGRRSPEEAPPRCGNGKPSSPYWRRLSPPMAQEKRNRNEAQGSGTNDGLAAATGSQEKKVPPAITRLPLSLSLSSFTQHNAAQLFYAGERRVK